MTNQNVLILYNEVFDDKGEVKLCGREKCKDLIYAMSSIFPYADFGDINTGFMNLKNMRDFKKRI